MGVNYFCSFGDDSRPAQHLHAWRKKGYGPKVTRLAARTPRYRRGDVRAWIVACAEGSAA
jgi:hypothetical protein